MNADDGSGEVVRRLALIGGACGTGVDACVDMAELGRDEEDFGFWNKPMLSSW